MIRLGLVDAAIVGGVDTLCGSVLFGFNALQLVSPEPCRPVRRRAQRHQHRRGGRLRAARARRGGAGDGLALLGYGESSDAHHMSTPHPEGLGAERALDDALARAGIDAERRSTTSTCTAPPAPRTTRSRRRWWRGASRRRTHASSTKGFTGHTLGAAGIVEAAASLLAIEHGFMPGMVNTRTLDAGLRAADPARAGARRGAAARSATRSASAATTASWCSATQARGRSA